MIDHTALLEKARVKGRDWTGDQAKELGKFLEGQVGLDLLAQLEARQKALTLALVACPIHTDEGRNKALKFQGELQGLTSAVDYMISLANHDQETK